MKMKKFPGRFSKNEARRRWEKDENFVIVPCKCRPFDIHGNLDYFSYLVIPEVEKKTHRTFDSFINSFCYYNCNQTLGMYPAYYVENI